MRLPRVRFTVRRMMAWVILTGVTLALARYSVVRWGSDGLTHLAYWAFLAIVVVPKGRRSRSAMFWVGFGGFGMLYLTFTSLGYLSLPFRLPTGLILDAIHDRLPTGLSVSAIDFHRAGHALFAVMAGILAGLVLASQVSANAVAPEAMPFRARVRANFPTVVGLLGRMRPGRR